jgi:hypothetical protein
MQKLSDSNKRARSSSKIPVVVVESHQHVLEHIHHVLRRKNLLKEQLYMLHFDAHSDLACPMNIPARLCFQPRSTSEEGDKDLYESLDLSSTGIAEWILPLTLAANLRHVDWIRPTSVFEQLPPGDHAYHVGVYIPEHDNPKVIASFQDLPDSARLRVDWDIPYYRDDAGGDSYIATNDLELKQTLNLRVSDATTHGPPIESEFWILDICLDYFCAMNPFVADLQRMSNEFTNNMDKLFRKSTLPSSRAFQTALTELLDTYSKQEPEKWSSSQAYIDTCLFFPSPVEAQELLLKLQQSLNDYHGNSNDLVIAATEAIPYWNMPHTNRHPSNDELRVAINLVCERIRLQSHPPFLVTVARSAADGFTPDSLVDELQSKILEAVHSISKCKCSRSCFLPTKTSNCCLEIIYDYDEWEGSSFSF